MLLVSEVHRGAGAECDICARVTLTNGNLVPSNRVLTALYGSTPSVLTMPFESKGSPNSHLRKDTGTERTSHAGCTWQS